MTCRKFALVGLLGLQACGGSGSGSSDQTPASAPVNTPVASPVTPPVTPPTFPTGTDLEPDDFRTTEFNASGGLEIINAAEGYAAQIPGTLAGAGTNIAIIDSGVDLHDDLSIADRFALTGTAFDDPAPHGTHVAGIAAARRNDFGVHGVAFNADIVSIRIAPTDFSNTNQLEDEPVIASAILSAGGVQQTVTNSDGSPLQSDPSAESDVLNMSFSTPDPDGLVLNAMIEAAANGKIMVAALGNQSLNGPISAPAIYASDPRLGGLGIAVGALDSSGESDTNFSNLCQGVREQCLFAPGEFIVSTLPNQGFGAISGTSMAAPHVAGAAATLLAAFPSRSPGDIVERLLSTADDLGAPGPDDRFGRGRLNLGAALSPVGFTSLPLTNAQPTVDMSSTANTLNLPTWVRAADLDQALNSVLLLDEQNFPFTVDLGNFTASNSAATPLSSFVDGSRSETARLTAPSDWEIGLSAESAGEDRLGYEPWQARQRIAEEEQPVLQIGHQLTKDLRLNLQSGGASDSSISASGEGFVEGWSRAQFAANTNDDQRRSTLTASLDVTSDIALRAVASESQDRQGHIGVTYRPNPQLTLDLQTGWLDERQSSWGLAGNEVFGRHSAESSQTELRASLDMEDGFRVYGGLGYALQQNSASRSEGVIVDIEASQAISAMAGVGKSEILGNDQLSLTVIQPFRPGRMTALVDIPVSQNADNSINRQTSRVGLEPGGRQNDWILSYQRHFDEHNLGLGLMGFAQIEPGHDAKAKPVFGAALRLNMDF